MRGTLTTLILIAAGFLAGCQTTYYDAGDTPIAISRQAAAAFERYKEAGHHPLFFAVSTDGRNYGYNSCPSTMCVSGSETAAIKLCQKSGKKCKIFGHRGQVVWKAPVKWPGYEGNEFPLAILRLEGRTARESSGTATFLPDQNRYQLSVRYAGSQCSGSADPAEGTWYLNCGGRRVSGTIVPGSATKFDGIAKDGKTQLRMEIQEKPETATSDGTTTATTKPADMAALDLCRTALAVKESRLAWGRRDFAKAYVDEAKRRGYSVNSCRDKANLAPMDKLTATRIKRFNLVTTSSGGEQSRSGFAVEIDGGNRFALSVNITDKGGIRQCDGEVDLFRMVWTLECPGFGDMSGSVTRGGGALYSGTDTGFEKGPVRFTIDDRSGAGTTS